MSYNAPGIGIFTPISSTTLTLGPNDAEVGTKITKGGEDYILAYNKGTSTANIGYGVILTAATSYSFSVSSLTQAGYCFGVVKHVQINPLEYGWLLTRGFVDMKNGMAGTAPAKGDLVDLSLDGGFAFHTATALSIPFGTVMSAGASGGTGASLSYLYVKCAG